MPLPNFAQEFQLRIVGTPEDLLVLRKFGVVESFGDSLAMVNKCQALRKHAQQDGYLNARFDPFWSDSRQLELRVDLGERFQWIYLKPGSVDPQLLQKIRFRDRDFRDRPFHYQEVASLLQKLAASGADVGHPFASAWLDSVQISESAVKAQIYYDQGPYITFDSLRWNKQTKLNSRFIHRYLKILPGSSYSESIIQTIPDRIRRLGYLTLTESPRLTFQNDQATTYLQVAPRKANRIDGVIGFLPNAKGDGQLLLTGQFNLVLQNMFGSGRGFGLQWESFKPQSQLLKVNFHEPLILGSPVNMDLRFNLLKEDSSFVNREAEIDLSYGFKTYGSLSIYSYIKATRLTATGDLKDATTLPQASDFDLNQFGISYRWSRLDDYLNPSRGLEIHLRLATGLKKIRKNSVLNDSLYSDLDLETDQTTWETRIRAYWPASKHWVFAASINAAGLVNDRLFLNDLYRLGGLKTLRGFSENSFFAQNYAYTSLEPRFYFETDSYLFAFYDQAWWLNYRLHTGRFEDRPGGWGAGLSLTTELGIFNFVWGVGHSKTQDIAFNQSKIHFGYVNKF